MTCIVNGDRRRSEVDGKGLVVPCVSDIFKGKQKHLERLIGASLSEPHTSVTALQDACVCLSVCVRTYVREAIYRKF